MSKYCINCKHFSPKLGDEEHEFARCSYHQTPSLVTGTLVRDGMYYCAAARSSATAASCGAEGKHYEEKAVSHV